MFIHFKSKLNHTVKYDIFFNHMFIQSICIHHNKETKIELSDIQENTEIEIRPSKKNISTAFLIFFKTLISVPIAYLLFSITWDKSFFQFDDLYYLQNGKQILLKNSENIHIDITKSSLKTKKSIKLSMIKINISNNQNKSIISQKNIHFSNLNLLRFQLFEMILFYSLWFLPGIGLFAFMSYLAFLNNNFFYMFLCLLPVCIFFSLCVYFIVKNIKLYLIYKDNQGTVTE